MRPEKVAFLLRSFHFVVQESSKVAPEASRNAVAATNEVLSS